MARGTVYPAEGSSYTDPTTGTRVRRVTDHPSIHHHPFYYLPPMDDAMAHLVFISHRSGRAEIYLELQTDRRIVQLTEHEGLAEWSVHPSHDGRFVYFTDPAGCWRVETATQRKEQLVSFATAQTRHQGFVGAAMGTTTLSRDDRWWAVPVNAPNQARMLLVDTGSGAADYILEADSIGHPEFHPDDSAWLRYAGPYHQRIWIARRDGSEQRLAYRRDATTKEWIVHETWRRGTREIVTTRWPHGMIGIEVDSGAVRQVCSFNAWHAAISRDGTQLVSDTTFPDRGLMLFDACDGVGSPRPLCNSQASNVGAHWNTDHCPYDDGPVQVYAPQHTHPHPAFSPDGRQVVFTSDRTGNAQVYVAEIPTDEIPNAEIPNARSTR